MVDILGGDSSSVVVHLYSDSVINYSNADMYLVRNFLSIVINILDSIGKKVDDSPYDELGITVKQRIYAIFRQCEDNI